MLVLVGKILSFLIMPITGFFVINTVIKDKIRLFSIKTISYLLILILINYLLYNVEYQSLITILNFLSIIICYKIIFNISFFKSILVSLYLIILMLVGEIILCIIVLPFISEEMIIMMRESMVVGNLIVSLIILYLSRINYIKKTISKLIEKLETYTKLKFILISILWVIVCSLLGYYVFYSGSNTISFWVSVLILLVFIILMSLFLIDKKRYISLNEKFDSLYGYIETMEEYIDSEKLNIHEYKNQLAVIKSMTNNSKIIKYIDSILNEAKNDIEWNSELKNLPKTGFKGLLHYKIAQASSKKLNVLVTISKTCSKYFKKMSINEIKELSRLIGIFLDNAIEETEKTTEKTLSIEIYELEKNLNIVISNSIKNNSIELSKLSKKGFSTKGKKRGNGLYLAKKIISKNNNISIETMVINNYFIQKLYINDNN